MLGEAFSQPVSTELPNNVCTTCHRPACDNRFTTALGDPDMPPPFKDYHRADVRAEDGKALRAWCARTGDRH